MAVAVARDAASGEDFAETSEDATETPTPRPRRSAVRREPRGGGGGGGGCHRRRARNPGGTPKKSLRKESPKKPAPPGSATPLGKTLEPDRAGWSAVVGVC